MTAAPKPLHPTLPPILHTRTCPPSLQVKFYMLLPDLGDPQLVADLFGALLGAARDANIEAIEYSALEVGGRGGGSTLVQTQIREYSALKVGGRRGVRGGRGAGQEAHGRTQLGRGGQGGLWDFMELVVTLCVGPGPYACMTYGGPRPPGYDLWGPPPPVLYACMTYGGLCPPRYMHA